MQKYIQRFFIIIYLIVTFLFAISIASRSVSNLVICIFSAMLLVLTIVLVKKKILNINKGLIITLLIIAILLRIGVFLVHYDKSLTSDYLFFYENATNFANGQEINNRYIATFPYLAPYVVLLGTFFKIFNSNNYLLVILLNTILDAITSVIIYKILSKQEKNTGYIGAILWVINPINIIWTTICCPVVVVNCGISCILYVFEAIKKAIEEKINWKKFLILNIIYGIVIGIFNTFRPIMIIIIIATIIYYLYKIINSLKQKKKNIIIMLGIVLILAFYQLINTLSNIAISKLIKQEASTTAGWTLYLGSNLEYNGMWNEPASEEYGELMGNKNISAEEIQEIFKDKAISKYKQNGLENLKLFYRKLKILTNNISGYSYQNLKEVATINDNILKIIRIITEIAMVTIILLNIYICIYLTRDVQIFENMLLYILVTVGIITSHIFVEVSPRYMLPLLPALTVIAAYSITKILAQGEQKNDNIKLLKEKVE